MTYLVTVTRQLADVLHVVVAYLRQVNHDVRLRTDVDGAAQRPLARLKVFAAFHVVEGSDLHVTKEWYHFQILVKVSHYFIRYYCDSNSALEYLFHTEQSRTLFILTDFYLT